MELKPGYKQTEVGVIPEAWGVSSLTDCCSKITDGTHDTPKPVQSGVPFLTAIHVKDNWIDYQSCLYVTKADHEVIFSRCNPEHGDVLMVNIGAGVATTALVDVDYEFSLKNVALLKPNRQRMVGAYLNYCLADRKPRITQALSSGGAQPFLSLTEIGEIKIPLPSPEEQHAIAEALGDIDALLGALTQLIAKKRDLKQAAMQQLLTGQSRLPGFSGEWSTYTFGELFDLLRNASNSRADLVAEGDIGYLHYGDIHTHGSPFFDCGRDLRTYISAEKVRTTPLMADGDLVMVDASEDTEAIGKAVEITGLNGHRAVAGLHTLLLRAKGNRLADGFKGYLQYFSAVREALVRMATGVSVYGISKSNVRTISLAVPDIDEQKAIAAVLSDMDAELAALEQRLAKTRDLKQGMMQELLTGRTRLV